MPPLSLLLHTDASLTGLGTHLDLTAAVVWSQDGRDLHIDVLEMKVVHLASSTFLSLLAWESVILMSDNATVVAYLKKQGEMVSRVNSPW